MIRRIGCGWGPRCFRSLQQRLEVLAGDLAVFEDLAEHPGADGFSCVDGDYRAPAIAMLNEMMAPPHPDDLEAGLTQRRDDLPAAQAGSLVMRPP